MDFRLPAALLALNRIGFGLAFLARPTAASRGWIGPAARTGGAQVMTRATGARDVALGAGALAGLAGRGRPEPWFAAQLGSDAADVVATWKARGELPARSVAFGLAMGAASTAIAAAYLAASTRAEAAGRATPRPPEPSPPVPAAPQAVPAGSS